MKLILLLIFSIQVYAGEISLSFDDAPTKDGEMYSGIERTKTLIDKLRRADVKAAFYVNSIRIDVDHGDSRLNQHSGAGHTIGNHTHSHSKISDV
jgi:peptidoglycan/xylan/chitin deacetylase (PgdA/CDA1 family)